jgi:imidazolonepropionase-like amidohydrolase
MAINIPPAKGKRRTWLRVGSLLNGTSKLPLLDAHVVYDKNAIVFAGTDSPPATVLDEGQSGPDFHLPDYTLLPGLIEAHAHLFLEGGELDPVKRTAYIQQAPEELRRLARLRQEPLVRLGVIAVRDAGDKDGVGLDLSRLYERADRPLMPYIDSPGAAIHHQGRYGGFMAEPLENFASPDECVHARLEAGSDRIKLIPTGIINFKKGAVTTEPQMTTEEVRAFVGAAKIFGKQTFAHASGDVGIERAIDGGVDSVEHGFFVRDDQLMKMRDRNIAWVPTFAPVQKQVDHAKVVGWDEEIVSNLKRILDQHATSLVNAYEMGVQIIAGSDAGSYGVAHGLGLLDELELMERAGLSPMAVINSATGTSSKRLAFKQKFGRIEAGFLSRFILTRHSPLETVANLRKERIVVFDDRVFESDEHMDFSGL